MSVIITTTGLSLCYKTRKKFKVEHPTDGQLKQCLQEDPADVSAEANSLLQFAQKDDQLILLHTDTPEAEQCAQILKHFFIHNKGFKETRLVKLAFQDNEAHIEAHGIRDLVNVLIDEIDKAKDKGQDVIINATAGFKAQVVYSTMIGMIYQIPVKYIYEHFNKVVTFTPIALDWDTNLFFSYTSFFRWIDETPRTEKEVYNRLQSIADDDREKIQSMLTLPDPDGEIFLSPMGNALRRRFERETAEAEDAPWPPESSVKSAKSKIANSIINHGHDYEDTKKICLKVAQIPYVHAITPLFFASLNQSRVAQVLPSGLVQLYWVHKGKAVKLAIQTTATGKTQTRKVADLIKKTLEID
jgi:putative CRISPR-associated protein (TIGR02619 family)